jgi:Trans-aconitate methyltransferase
MADWDSAQYLKFKNERTQPAIDLVNRISLGNPLKIADIGCGPGNSTQVLAARFPNAKIIGIDSSENMVAAARKQYPGLEFRVGDASGDLTGLGTDFDLVFSNACIQWIEGHERLLPNLMKLLKTGGVLAVQTPMNYEEPIHKLIQRMAASPKWKPFFPHPRIFYNLTQEEYFDLLSEISPDFSIWQTTYFHTMDSHRDIFEWYRSTGLKPYLDVLPEDEKPAFEKEILEGIRAGYPQQRNGKIIFRFPRFFFTAAAGSKE